MYLYCWLHTAYTPRSYEKLQNLIKLCPQDTVPPKSFFHYIDDHFSLFPPLGSLNSIPTPGMMQRKKFPRGMPWEHIHLVQLIGAGILLRTRVAAHTHIPTLDQLTTWLPLFCKWKATHFTTIITFHFSKNITYAISSKN